MTRNAQVGKGYADKFAPVKALEVNSTLGGWSKASAEFFANNAPVDTLLNEIAAERKK